MQLRNALLTSLVLIAASYYGLYVSFPYIYPKPHDDLKAKESREKMPTPKEDDEARLGERPTPSPNLPDDFKYILTWTNTPGLKNTPLHGWAYPGLHGFKAAGCEEFRCYLTNNRSYLGIEMNSIRNV